MVNEGNYTTWTHQWTFQVPDNVTEDWGICTISTFIDERSDVFSLWWEDKTAGHYDRFGVYALSDHSTVFQSSSGSDYTLGHPESAETERIQFGCIWGQRGMSRSLESYLLIPYYTNIFEVWRGGATPLVHINIRDALADSSFVTFEISPTGKHILISARKGAMGSTIVYLMLYEGA